jgi:AhpD family alkylhydroperoxidase
MKIRRFKEGRELLNKIVLPYSDKNIRDFYDLDSQIFQEASLSKKTKEMLGLVASFVMRCNDCITFHLINCFNEGVSDEEIAETLAVGLFIGGR